MCRVSLGLLQKSVFMPGILVDGSGPCLVNLNLIYVSLCL